MNLGTGMTHHDHEVARFRAYLALLGDEEKAELDNSMKDAAAHLDALTDRQREALTRAIDDLKSDDPETAQLAHDILAILLEPRTDKPTDQDQYPRQS